VKGLKGLDFDLARWPDFSRPAGRSSRGVGYSDLSEDVIELPFYSQRGMGGLRKYWKKLKDVFGKLRHARRPARNMPEILKERFARAKSGLMLAPAKTQALLVSDTAIVQCMECCRIRAYPSPWFTILRLYVKRNFLIK
jgi:hypothetical protein